MEAGQQAAWRRRPAPLHGQFSRNHLPHLPAHEGERSTLSARVLRGTGGGRQATYRMVSDAPSSSSDQQRVKVVERSHRRQSSAAQKAAGAVRRVAARPRLASSVGCGTKRAGFGGRSLPPYLTLPYRTLPYPRRLPVLLQMAVVVGKEFFFFAFEVYYINSLCVSCLLDNQQFI